MANQGEAAPQYSSFLHLHFIFQILSDKQLLPEHNLNQCSFWETYLTTSDPQHKGWTYILCSSTYFVHQPTSDPQHKGWTYILLALFREITYKELSFLLIPEFWTQTEEYLLKNTVFIFKRSPQDRWSMSLLPCLWFLSRSLLLSPFPQFWSAHAGSAGWWD